MQTTWTVASTTGPLVMGVSIGGTNIGMGLVDSQGKIFEPSLRSEYVGQIGATPETVLPMIASAAREYTGKYGAPSAIGIGFPGWLSSNGRVFKAPNMRGFEGRIVAGELHKEPFGLDPLVFVDNDANTAGWGELRYGVLAELGVRNAIGVTQGTGLGGYVIVDGEVIGGDLGFAGEFGHIQLAGLDRMFECGCGRPHCLESLTATRAFNNIAAMQGEGGINDVLARTRRGMPRRKVDLTPERMAEWADGEDGDLQRITRSMWMVFGGYLGTGLAQVVRVLAPSHIVLGGNIAYQSLQRYEAGIRKGLEEELGTDVAGLIQLHRAAIPSKEGEIIGSAAMARRGIGGPVQVLRNEFFAATGLGGGASDED